MYKLPNGKMVYPEDIECVHDPINGKGGIFIGNLQAAQNLQTLKKYGIKAVLTAAKGVFLNHCKNQIPYQLYIPGQDHQKFDISKYFNQSISFIRDTLQKTNILVHCLAGVSRSVSLVMAYFIKYQNMGYENVYTKIKSRRKIIHPNDGFIYQLKKFQSQCRQRGPVNQRSQLFQMRSSYSPSKRYQRRRYQGYQASPQKFYESPQKRYTRDPNDFRYTQLDKNDRKTDRYNYSGENINNVRNPQLYKSYVQNMQFKSQKIYKEQNTVGGYSPDRTQRINRMNSNLGYKKPSLNNVDLQKPLEVNVRRSDLYKNLENLDLRGRISSQYKPLDSIQNRQQDNINVQIDRKIAQIRKKYQQYTKPQRGIDRNIKIDRKYSNISSIQQKNENFNNFDEIKIRKINSYNQHISQSYSGITNVKKDNYLLNQASNSNASFIGNRLRRLQSYQV